MAREINGIDKQLLQKILQTAKNLPSDEVEKRSRQAIPTKPTKQQAQQLPITDEPRDPPVHTISTGSVVTRIWARQDVLGQVRWNVDQRRFRSDGTGGAVCKSFYPDQLDDAMRGLFEAQKWIKKADKKLNRRWFW